MTREPEPGDFGLVPTYGNGMARFFGWLIRWGCATPTAAQKTRLMRALYRVPILGWLVFLLDGRLWKTSRVNHAFLYVGGGMIVEMEPRGAVLTRLHYKPDSIIWSTGKIRLNRDQRHTICDTAHLFVAEKIGYGWLDIVCIALAQKRAGSSLRANLPIDRQPWFWRKVLGRVESLRQLICSQSVDVAYETGDRRLFGDGRFPGLVSPQDLAGLLAVA